MATMEVILREKIEGLGAEADIVKIKAGYGRNFLIPQGKAFEATSANRRYIASLKKAREQREATERAAAQEVATKIAATPISLHLQAGQGGKAFGAVTNQDIATALEAKGIVIDRHAIELEKSIKTAGEFELAVKLHSDVVASLKLTVVLDGAEAAE